MNAVDRYVTELGRAVRGPRRARLDVLREVRDGLTDAADAHVDGGHHPAAARAMAVAEFGTVAELAPLYQAELTARQGRTAALYVALVFPAMTVGWALMWRSGVSWGPLPDATTTRMVHTLSALLDTVALGVAGLASALFVLTFVRAVPARPLTVVAGGAAGLGSLALAGLSAWMNVLGGSAAGVAATSPGPAVIAYTVSCAALVTTLAVSVRTVRTALH